MYAWLTHAASCFETIAGHRLLLPAKATNRRRLSSSVLYTCPTHSALLLVCMQLPLLGTL